MMHDQAPLPRLLLWDLDGTLVDSRKDLVMATNMAVQELGYAPVKDDHFSRMVGNGVRYLVNAALPETALPAEREQAIEIFLAYYRLHIADETRFFPGIQPILETLPAIHAIVSNKREDLCRELIGKMRVGSLFSEIVGGDTYPRRKPDPEPVLRMIRHFGVTPERTLLVGDSVVDMEAGRRAGVRTIGVTWGFGNPLEREEFTPDWVFEEVGCLSAFLSEWCGILSEEIK
ncbi:MAG: HAD family hydrolase [Leptospirales bacterium]